MVIAINGFHGTSGVHSNSIIKSGLIPSIGDDEWLGDGGYFFIEGISKKPELQAKEWAIAQSWDKASRKSKYCTYTVLIGLIKIEEDFFLDLTTSDGVEILEYLQKKCIEKLKKNKKNNLKFLDGYIINFARGENIKEIKASKGNFFIKFKTERIGNVSRRTPNCTICAVYDPQSDIKDMKVLEKGRIENEIR